MTIDAKKIGLLHVAKKRLGFDDDTWHGMLGKIAGVGSSRDLDREGFARVMDYLRTLGFESTRHKAAFGDRATMASAAQVEYMRALWANFTDGTGTDASLGKWLEGRFKVTALRFVDYRLAPKAIAALKAMNARRGKAGAPKAGDAPPPPNGF